MKTSREKANELTTQCRQWNDHNHYSDGSYFAWEHIEREIAVALDAARDEALEEAALLFDEYHNGHRQEFTGGADDSCELSYRVMWIIRDNIRALKGTK